MTTLRKRTTLGFFWAGAGRFSSQAIAYATLVSYAWLLSPDELGLVGFGFLVVNVATRFGQLGVSASLIQRQTSDQRYLSTAFWANCLINTLIGLSIFLSANIIANILGDIRAGAIIQWLSLLFPLQATEVVPRALLLRNIDFKWVSLADIAGEILFGLTVVLLAINGYGAWSLVIGALLKPLARLTIVWSVTTWRPILAFDISVIQDLLSFGFPVALSATLSQMVSNADYFVIARYLGTETLGIYTLAFQLAVLPAQTLSNLVRDVAFPSFAKLDSVPGLRTAYVKLLELLMAVLLPFSVALIILSTPLILSLYSQKWFEAIPVMQILAVAAFFYGFDIVESVYYTLNRPIIRVWIITLRLLIFLSLSFALFQRYSLAGIAWSVSISAVISSFAAIIISNRLLSLNIVDIYHALKRTIYSAVLAIAAWLMFRHLVLIPFRLTSSFLVSAVSLAVIYLLVSLLIYRTRLKILKHHTIAIMNNTLGNRNRQPK